MRRTIAILACAGATLLGCSGGTTSGSSGSTGAGGTTGSGSSTSGTTSASGSSGSSATSSGSSGSTAGSGSGGTTGVAGSTVEGPEGFTVQVAQELQFVTDGGGSVSFQDTAYLADSPYASACAPQNLAARSLQVFATRLDSPVTPGTYTADPGGSTYAGFYMQLDLPDGGFLGLSSGPTSPVTVVVTRADDGGFAGSYSGSIFPDGGPFQVSGTFDVAPCP